MSVPALCPSGLTAAEAAARLASEGPNELQRDRRRGVLRIAAGVLREPMFQLLLVSGLIYLVLGNLGEALILLGFALANVVLVIYQESKTERVLGALRDLTSPRALVIRDGERQRIAGREVVPGDIVVLAEGDRVPADALVLQAADLLADESLLTGESVSVRKSAWDGSPGPMPRPGGDDVPFVFSGTLVVRGQGIAEVRTTGARTAIGGIGAALHGIEDEATPLHRQTQRLVRVLATVGIGLSVLLAMLYGLIRGGWLDGVLAGITLAMSILPEELPLILTVFLVVGAWRISQKRVLTRRASAIEALGAATILCTDKTGTLTLNRMTVAHLVSDDAEIALDPACTGLPERVHTLVEFGILASQRDPLDPMERAFHELGARCLANTEHLHGDWTLQREYPLRPDLLAMSHVWKAGGRDVYIVAAKGAPEAIADLCHLPAERLASVRQQVDRMANSGLRVLAVARAAFRGDTLPDLQHDFGFEFLGLVGLADPLRPGVPEAIRECRDAGIRIAMVTGDHPATAKAIAARAGLHTAGGVVTGVDLERMNDGALREKIGSVTIFARIMPEQKLRLVEAFKANGEIVAMTGDGVNDAPSLKAAHIGIAMGGRGTDVAREAAALVLLDDDFTSIVAAVRLGRRIYENIRKAIGFTFAVHVPIAGLALLPVLFGWPLIFSPVHIVFLELVIDPVCSIVFEAEREEEDVMARRPRDAAAPLVDRWLLQRSLLQGLTVLAAVLAVFLGALHFRNDAADARTIAFATLVVANFGLVLTNRSVSAGLAATLRRPNPALGWVAAAAFAALAAALGIPWLRHVFAFAPLDAAGCGIALLCGAATLFVHQIVKALHGDIRRAAASAGPTRAAGI